MSRGQTDEVKRIAAHLDGFGTVGAEIFLTKEEILSCETIDAVKQRINEKLIDALEAIYSELGI